MIVVADTSPINYLLTIGLIELLPACYSKVLIPPAVLVELSQDQAPKAVRGWIASRPQWLEVREPFMPRHGIPELHLGERQAIQLALDLGVGILLDDHPARMFAQELSLPVTGTIGILEDGAKRGLIDFLPAFDNLLRTNFRLSASLRSSVLRRHGRR